MTADATYIVTLRLTTRPWQTDILVMTTRADCILFIDCGAGIISKVDDRRVSRGRNIPGCMLSGGTVTALALKISKRGIWIYLLAMRGTEQLLHAIIIVTGEASISTKFTKLVRCICWFFGLGVSNTQMDLQTQTAQNRKNYE